MLSSCDQFVLKRLQQALALENSSAGESSETSTLHLETSQIINAKTATITDRTSTRIHIFLRDFF
jgi:hypothetical protein